MSNAKAPELPAFQCYQLAFTAHLRDLADWMRFIVLNPVSARLVSLLETGELSGRAALLRLGEEMHHPEPENMLRLGVDILQKLHAEQAILGTR